MEEKHDECKSGCGLRCGCCCKAIKALVLLLVGGILGFFIGRCRSGFCPLPSGTQPAVSAPAPARLASTDQPPMPVKTKKK